MQFKLFDGTDCSIPTTAVSPNSWTKSVEVGEDPMGWGEENDNFGWAVDIT